MGERFRAVSAALPMKTGSTSSLVSTAQNAINITRQIERRKKWFSRGRLSGPSLQLCDLLHRFEQEIPDDKPLILNYQMIVTEEALGLHWGTYLIQVHRERCRIYR